MLCLVIFIILLIGSLQELRKVATCHLSCEYFGNLDFEEW